MEYYLQKKGGHVVRKIVRRLPDNHRVYVHEYFVGSGNALSDTLTVDTMSRWGRPISEAEARCLVPNMDKLDRKLFEELSSSPQYQLLEALGTYRKLLRELVEATAKSRSKPIIEARTAALDFLGQSLTLNGQRLY